MRVLALSEHLDGEWGRRRCTGGDRATGDHWSCGATCGDSRRKTGGAFSKSRRRSCVRYAVKARSEERSVASGKETSGGKGFAPLAGMTAEYWLCAIVSFEFQTKSSLDFLTVLKFVKKAKL